MYSKLLRMQIYSQYFSRHSLNAHVWVRELQ
jgi:hypothetical protein